MKAEDNEFPSVLFDDQSSTPATPDSGFSRIYTKSDGLYIVDDAGGVTGPFIDTGGGGGGPDSVVLGSNRTSSSTSYADVTGLSFAVTNGVAYAFDFFIRFSTPVNTTGIALSMNGPTASIYTAQSIVPTGANSVEGIRNQSAYDTGTATSGNSGTGIVSMARIWGVITPSADGTLIVRFASEVGASTVTVYAGSCGFLYTL